MHIHKQTYTNSYTQTNVHKFIHTRTHALITSQLKSAPGFCMQFGECLQTPYGYYSPANRADCIPCPDAELGNTLTSCPAHTPEFNSTHKAVYWNQTADTCHPGYCIQETVTGSACLPAKAGTWVPRGTSQCLGCLGSTATMATSCSCLAAGQCMIDGNCVKVPPGMYSPSGVDFCLDCMDGEISSDKSSCFPRAGPANCTMSGMCYSPDMTGLTRGSCGPVPRYYR